MAVAVVELEGKLMSGTLGATSPPGAAEVDRLLKRNYVLLVQGFLLRLVIFGALSATPVVLSGTGTWDSPVLAVLTVAGVLGVCPDGLQVSLCASVTRQVQAGVEGVPPRFPLGYVQEE